MKHFIFLLSLILISFNVFSSSENCSELLRKFIKASGNKVSVLRESSELLINETVIKSQFKEVFPTAVLAFKNAAFGKYVTKSYFNRGLFIRAVNMMGYSETTQSLESSGGRFFRGAREIDKKLAEKSVREQLLENRNDGEYFFYKVFLDLRYQKTRGFNPLPLIELVLRDERATRFLIRNLKSKYSDKEIVSFFKENINYILPSHEGSQPNKLLVLIEKEFGLKQASDYLVSFLKESFSNGKSFSSALDELGSSPDIDFIIWNSVSLNNIDFLNQVKYSDFKHMFKNNNSEADLYLLEELIENIKLIGKKNKRIKLLEEYFSRYRFKLIEEEEISKFVDLYRGKLVNEGLDESKRLGFYKGIETDSSGSYFEAELRFIKDQILRGDIKGAKKVLRGKDVEASKIIRRLIDKELDENLDNPEVVKQILKVDPEIKTDFTTRAIELGRFDLVDLKLFENKKFQRDLDISLKNKAEELTKSSNAPASFSNWGEYINQLPEALRKNTVLDLLNNNSDKESVVKIISELEPGAGVNDAIWYFFRSGNGSPFLLANRSLFSHNELAVMFGGDRFQKFYPHVSDGAEVESGGIRTKFMLANFMVNVHAPRVNVDNPWLIEKATHSENSIRRAFPEVAGFYPSTSYDWVRHIVDQNFITYGGNAQAQINGMIVQGAYEKSNYSLMMAITNRGGAHIENTIPSLNRRIERSLRGGSLAQADELSRRFFVYEWGNLNSSGTLIERVRQEAINVANLDGNFWSLRVEIHNFPTRDTLRRVKEFRETRTDEGILREIDSLIGNIESVLGIRDGVEGGIDSVINSLRLSDENRDILKELVLNDERASVERRLRGLSDLRSRYKEMKNPETSESASAMTDRYLGDRLFSEYAMKLISNALEKQGLPENLVSLKNFNSLVESIIDHIQIDNMLSVDQVENYKKIFGSLLSSRGLHFERKRELYLLQVKNIIDQVFFKLSRDYSGYDDFMFSVVDKSSGIPVRFIDDTLRSSNIFLLSKLVDKMDSAVLESKNIKHLIDGREFSKPVEVFNPGVSVGILRVNKNPMELKQGEIGVFSQVPEETGALDGIITLGVGARLSHLQLLAKSLGIPNSKISADYLDEISTLDGRMVRYECGKDGVLKIEPIDSGVSSTIRNMNIQVPSPNHSIIDPITFKEAGNSSEELFAGPKGIQLSKMFVNKELGKHVPDGAILPFGFFKKYSDSIGLSDLIENLSRVELSNEVLISAISGQIKKKIFETDIPSDILDQVIKSLEDLKSRTKHEEGYFFRSDTNIEDLPGFNGAGLNESVANVNIEREAVENALKKVWYSAFKEKSIFWRAMALPNETVTIAEPSIVIMPTVQAQSSGVILSRGGESWDLGRGLISSNWGIGSVVEAGQPVEEISLEAGEALHYALTVSNLKPSVDESGGLQMIEVDPGQIVLSSNVAGKLNDLAGQVEKTLGEQEHGWDIEWAVDSDGIIRLLQARPNM